ncbi:MAG: IS110 family transposase [Myxococcota bacterium]
MLAFELGETGWKLGFTSGFGHEVLERNIASRDTKALLKQIAWVKRRLGLPQDAPVRSLYEAGRDGFWLHRFLEAHGVENLVVDSASIEVNRKRRRAKSDRLDVVGLLDLLIRHWAGSPKPVLRPVRVPSVDDEDARHLHRELGLLKKDRTRVSNRIHGLLANVGLKLSLARLGSRLETLRFWDGSPLGPGLRGRLDRYLADRAGLDARIQELEGMRRTRLREDDSSPALEKVRQLDTLRGIGTSSAWLLVMEFFVWRDFQNRREVGSAAGLTPTPFDSGKREREQGIGKDGNHWVRGRMVELAWAWLRHQPKSELTLWYQRRFAGSGKRGRKIGIVALARKLLIELWRFLETGEVPAGAELKPAVRTR